MRINGVEVGNGRDFGSSNNQNNGNSGCFVKLFGFICLIIVLFGIIILSLNYFDDKYLMDLSSEESVEEVSEKKEEEIIDWKSLSEQGYSLLGVYDEHRVDRYTLDYTLLYDEVDLRQYHEDLDIDGKKKDALFFNKFDMQVKSIKFIKEDYNGFHFKNKDLLCVEFEIENYDKVTLSVDTISHFKCESADGSVEHMAYSGDVYYSYIRVEPNGTALYTLCYILADGYEYEPIHLYYGIDSGFDAEGYIYIDRYSPSERE